MTTLLREVVTNYDYEGQIYDFPVLIEKRPTSIGLLENFNFGFFLNEIRLHYETFATRIGTCHEMKPGWDSSRTSERDKRKDETYAGMMQLVKAQTYDVHTSILRDKAISYRYYPLFFAF